jgi:hypothetical protein
MNATLISMMPCPLVEKKPGLVPDTFFIPAAEKDGFQIILVHDSRFPVYIDHDRGTIWIPAPGETIAESIVRDYNSAQLNITESSRPGIFWLPGEFSSEQIRERFADRLKKERDTQIRWFKSLVQLADDDWNRFRQHRMISDIQRYAAEYLGSEREWLSIDLKAAELQRCPACAVILQNPAAAICMNCRCVLNRAKYEALTFAGEVSAPVELGPRTGAPVDNTSVSEGIGEVTAEDIMNDLEVE